MIIFFQNGRLGNQLFQYAALKQLFVEHRLVLFGFDSLVNVCTHIDAITITKKVYKYQILFSIIMRILNILAKTRLIGLIYENDGYDDDFRVVSRSGLIKSISLVSCAFFQDKAYESKISEHLSIKPELIDAGSKILNDLVGEKINRPLIFVHVRRGDYVSWPDRKNPAVVPAEWYKDNMARIRNELSKPFFLICTDDIPYAKEMFYEMKDIHISEFDEITDFALMSLCNYGILSASSFSWWAAFFSRRNSVAKLKNFGFFGPKYWVGHRNMEWSPRNLISDWINYVPVDVNRTD